MEKVPFTQQGFTDLADELYALNNDALFAEADAILEDYVQWAIDHIELSTAQVNFLNNLDPLFIASLATNAALAFRNRLTLKLILPLDYPRPEDNGKWFIDRSDVEPSTQGGNVIVATGEIKYEIKYP